jgi:hypothetical protein
MQYANIMLALGGDTGTTVPKSEVSASEIAVLRLIHGAEAVFDVEPVKVDDEKAKRTSREEIRRLTEIYGRARVDTGEGTAVSPITALFPGAGAKAIAELEDLDIPSEFFKAKSRVSVDDASEDEASDDGLGKMNKAELLEEAERRGVEASSSMTKAEIVEALRAGGKPEDEVFA